MLAKEGRGRVAALLFPQTSLDLGCLCKVLPALREDANILMHPPRGIALS